MDLERIIGSIVTEQGPQPFALNTLTGKFKLGDYIEPDEAQGQLSIIQQQRFSQLIAERAGVAFAHVRLGQYYHKKSDRWVNVLQEEWSYDQAEPQPAAALAEDAEPVSEEPETEAAVPEPAAETPTLETPASEPDAAFAEFTWGDEAPPEEASGDGTLTEAAMPDAAPVEFAPVEFAPLDAAPAETQAAGGAFEETREAEEPAVIDAVLLPDNDVMLEKAIRIAVEAHSGQADKAGQPYILHPLRMMLRMEDPTAMMAAVLHDVVEDTGWTLEALRREGFSEAVVEAVDGLTRRAKESYEAFIDRAAGHPVARRVKLADLEDNMDIRRLGTLTKKDQARLLRYQKAWRRLKDAD